MASVASRPAPSRCRPPLGVSRGISRRREGQVEDAVDKGGDKIGDGLDKAGDLIDDKTGGKFDDKIDDGVDKAKDALDSLDGKDDDIK